MWKLSEDNDVLLTTTFMMMMIMMMVMVRENGSDGDGTCYAENAIC